MILGFFGSKLFEFFNIFWLNLNTFWSNLQIFDKKPKILGRFVFVGGAEITEISNPDFDIYCEIW